MGWSIRDYVVFTWASYLIQRGAIDLYWINKKESTSFGRLIGYLQSVIWKFVVRNFESERAVVYCASVYRDWLFKCQRRISLLWTVQSRWKFDWIEAAQRYLANIHFRETVKNNILEKCECISDEEVSKMQKTTFFYWSFAYNVNSAIN